METRVVDGRAAQGGQSTATVSTLWRPQMRYAACMGVADQCFPPSATDRHTAHLRSYFLVQFCKPHTCERAHQRPFSLGPLIGDSKWGWLVASVVVLTMLAFFYAITG